MIVVDVVNEMETFKKTMWDNMQRRVAAIFASPNLSTYKIDDFLKVFIFINNIIILKYVFIKCLTGFGWS